MSADKYGEYYWCVVSGDKEIYLHADSAVVTQNGALSFRRDNPSQQLNVVFAPGHWDMFYAASVIDGGAIAVEHWD